eukprot:jgi/Botrbrau1/10946/Bobra.0383s0003.1
MRYIEDVNHLQSKLQELQRRRDSCNMQKDDCEKALQCKRGILEQVQHNDGQQTVGLLEKQLISMEDEEKNCLAVLSSLVREVARLEVEYSDRQPDQEQVQAAQTAILQRRARTLELKTNLHKMEASQAAEIELVKRRKERKGVLGAEIATIKEKCSTAEKEMQATKARLKELQKQEFNLQEEAKNIHLALQGWRNLQGDPVKENDLEWFENQHAKWQKRLTDCQVQKESLRATRFSDEDMLGMQERKAQVNTFRGHCDALATAITIMEESVAKSKAEVEKTYFAMLEKVSERFVKLTEGLLPRMQFRCMGTSLHTVYIEFSCDGGSNWEDRLHHLSGGQRSLVALAFLIAVAAVGGRGSLFLLDEVDAALDEANQQSIGILLKKLHDAYSLECQILCVTHNASFISVCDNVIQVKKEACGTVMS